MNKFMELWIALVAMRNLKSYTQKLNRMAILLQYHIIANVLTVEPPLEKKRGIIELIGIGLEKKKQKKFLTNSFNCAIILTESEVNKMKHNLLYVSCPICGKQLIDLAEGDPACEANEHMYWCDECKVDITIIESEEGE